MIFTILKIIGIILLCILALILLILLLLLFAPFRYYSEATYDKEDNNLYVLLRFKWLIIFKVDVCFKDKALSYCVKALFFKIIDSNRIKKDTTNKASKQIEAPKKDSKAEEIKSAETKSEEIKHEEADAAENKKSLFWVLNPAVWYYRISESILGFFDRINNSRDKLVKKLFDICNMVSSEENRNLIVFLLAELKKILRHIKPLKHGIYIKEGFKDPALTGEIMAAYSVIKSISSLNIVVCPDFDEEVLSVQAYIKGRIRVFNLLVTGFKVYTNKSLKKLIRRM